ncbi:hypothetical protein [Arenimonas fontis]|uniref:Uncharacterized protein n=1 Tax=Arenimonas fontis TaxID=2608255 RepID=A0A5B2Z8X0_9GAMM|nr:hypothetical protein [Arenimonas fontis]KAA2284345.1 hypothetical protein F0415_09775 [Arenimonas fontis]
MNEAAGTARRRLWRGLALLLVLAALVAWGMDRQRERAQRQAAADELSRVLAEFRRGLPTPYAPGLVTESAGFEGTALVMTIRAEKRRVGDGDEGQLAAVRRAEQALMLPLCASADVRFLLARGLTIKRRFVDGDGRVFFDIELGADDCGRARTGVTP